MHLLVLFCMFLKFEQCSQNLFLEKYECHAKKLRKLREKKVPKSYESYEKKAQNNGLFNQNYWILAVKIFGKYFGMTWAKIFEIFWEKYPLFAAFLKNL